MREIRVASAQFENRDNDKAYNLSRIRELTHKAVDEGAEIVSFHEERMRTVRRRLSQAAHKGVR